MTYRVARCPFSHNSNRTHIIILSTRWIIFLRLRIRSLLLSTSRILIGKVTTPQRHLIGQLMSRHNSRQINSFHIVTKRISIPTNKICKMARSKTTSSSSKVKALIFNKTPLKLVVAAAIFKTNSTHIGVSSKILTIKIINLLLKLKIFKLRVWIRWNWTQPWIQRWISRASLKKGLTFRTIIIRWRRVTLCPTRCRTWTITCHLNSNNRFLAPLIL